MTGPVTSDSAPSWPKARALDPTTASPKLRRDRGSSLNHQVFLVLRDHIVNGIYEVGEALPSEDELCRIFSVSRITIRTALASLQAEGMVERRQGVGTFVADNSPPFHLHTPVIELIEHIADVDRKSEIRLLDFDYVRAPAHIQAMFACPPDAVFQRAVRLRLIAKVPVFHVITFIPQDIAKEFTREDLSSTSLYKLFERSGVKLHSGKQVVSAQLASPGVAQLLDVDVGSPLLQIRRQHYVKSGRLVEYFEMLASPTMFELNMTLDAGNLPS